MIDSLKILEAVTRQAAAALPELEEVYIDLVPKNFKRPSLLAQAVHMSETSANKTLVNVNAYVTVTVIDKTDDYDRSSTERLLHMQSTLIRLYRKGYLEVSDDDGTVRMLEMQASTGGRDWDKAYIDLQFEYFDVRDETPDVTPIMESIDASITLKE